MVETDLIDHGWTYINMDDKWEGQRNAKGNIQASASFPDMKGMADYIHGLGLKVGLYSSPGPFTCAGAIGSYQHEDQDAQTYADWTMDYLKYDWCSYQQVIADQRVEKFAAMLPASAAEIRQLGAQQHDLMERYRIIEHSYVPAEREERGKIGTELGEIRSKLEKLYGAVGVSAREAIYVEGDKAPYQLMRASLDKVNRDIVYSFCQYGIERSRNGGRRLKAIVGVSQTISTPFGKVCSHMDSC